MHTLYNTSRNNGLSRTCMAEIFSNFGQMHLLLDISFDSCICVEVMISKTRTFALLKK